MIDSAEPNDRIKVLIVDDGCDKARAAALVQKLTQDAKDHMQVVVVSADTAPDLSVLNGARLRADPGDACLTSEPVQVIGGGLRSSIARAITALAAMHYPAFAEGAAGKFNSKTNEPYYRQFEKKGRKK